MNVVESPSTQVRHALETILSGEFGEDELEVRHGKLHDSINGPLAVAGTYPLSEAEGRNVLDQETLIMVQVFLPWPKEIDPQRVREPELIEQWAERFREAVFDATHPVVGASAAVWYFRVLRVDYKTDPIGDISRFEATVLAFGQNFSETNAG